MVLGERAAMRAAETIALLYLRDAMMDSMDMLLQQLSLLYPLLQREDPELVHFLTRYVSSLKSFRNPTDHPHAITVITPHRPYSRCGVLPYFSLSWVLTWCAHDVRSYEMVTRLFDVFLCSPPMMPVYFAAVVGWKGG